MSIIDRVLIGLSVCNCVLSAIAVHLVRQGLKKRKEIIAYEIAYEAAVAEAHEKSRIVVSVADILQTVETSRLVESTDSQQVIQVKGTLNTVF